MLLEIIQKYFDWNNREWTIIEVVESGEVVSYTDYLICYGKESTRIITYKYLRYKWDKSNEKYASFDMKDVDVETAKVPYYSNNHEYRVIVTHFKSDTVLESVYLLSTTLSDKSK